MTRSITRAGLFARPDLIAARETLVALAAWLETRGVTPVFEAATAQLAGAEAGKRETASADELPTRVDLMISLGGDGTLLAAADRMAAAGADIPIVGVNFGSLGFLTEVTLSELYDAMAAVLDGNATMEPRMRLRAIVGSPGAPTLDRVVLNDIVITRGSLSRMIDLDVSVDDGFVTRVKADG